MSGVLDDIERLLGMEQREDGVSIRGVAKFLQEQRAAILTRPLKDGGGNPGALTAKTLELSGVSLTHGHEIYVKPNGSLQEKYSPGATYIGKVLGSNEIWLDGLGTELVAAALALLR